MTAASAGPASAAPRPDWRLVVGFAALTILIHFLTNGAYGYFRDELYFIACGYHLAWGYVDMPPMAPLVARLSRAAMGDSLFAIRFFPALAGGATVALAGILAWELGGRRFAQALAMLAAMLAPIYLGLGTILTMNVFDAIFWMGCVWALIRLIKTGDPRWWLLFGASAGLGLENKESMVFLGFGIVVGLAVVPERKLMFNRWFVFGGIVALLLFMPTLVWQAMHNFPMYEELSNVKGSTKNAPVTLLSFLGAQVLLLLPPSCVIWASGLYFFPDLRARTEVPRDRNCVLRYRHRLRDPEGQGLLHRAVLSGPARRGRGSTRIDRCARMAAGDSLRASRRDRHRRGAARTDGDSCIARRHFYPL